MATVFDLFNQVPYEYLVIGTGGVVGNTIVSRTTLSGVFKLRSGVNQSPAERELTNSDATLHVHPEDFTDKNSIVGNGVCIDGQDYRIVGMTDGRNFHDGVSEHYKLTLEKASYADYS